MDPFALFRRWWLGARRVFPALPLMATAAAAEPATYELGEYYSIDWEPTAFAVGEGFAAFGAARYNEVNLQDADQVTNTISKFYAPAADVTASGTLQFGAACGLGSSSLLVGAPGFKAGGTAVGKVYLYAPGATGTWAAAGSLANPDPSCPGFGRRIVVKGSRAFVFAPRNGVDGLIHPYEQQADRTWLAGPAIPYPADLQAATSAAEPAVVGAIEFDGSTLVLGFPRGMNDRGVVCGFRQLAGAWSEVFRIPGSEGGAERLGSSLCLAGDELLMGGPATGKGRVARVSLAAGGAPVALPDLELPKWVARAGAALAHHDGRLMVGAPGTTFISRLSDQGAVLIADRTAQGGWEWTGLIGDPGWSPILFGYALFATPNRFFAAYSGGGQRLQALVPGERVTFSFEPAVLDVQEDAARVDLWVSTSRPVNTTMLLSLGEGSGTATPGGDYFLLEEPQFLWPGETAFDFPVMVVRDALAEPTEETAYPQVKLYGGDREGGHPVIRIHDRPAEGLPSRIIGHLEPDLTELRPFGAPVTPSQLSMTENELLVAYAYGSNPWIQRYLRTAEGSWIQAADFRVTAPTDASARRAGMGAMVHDESLLLIGESGDLYTQGHLRTFVRDPQGGWTTGASFWPTGLPGGSFGKEVILTPSRVFVNQGNYGGNLGSRHGGYVHAFTRSGPQLTLQKVLGPEQAGFVVDPWLGSEVTFGEEIAWSDPYLAVSLSRSATNGLLSQGVALFRFNAATGNFDWLQNLWFEAIGSGARVLEFAGDLLMAGIDGRKLRLYSPDPATGLFVGRPPLEPPGSYATFQSTALAAPGGILIGMQEAGLDGAVAVPQLAGYQRVGDGLRPSFCHGAPFYWYGRAEAMSRVTPGGRFAVAHLNSDRQNRREIFILELGSSRPALTLTPEVAEVASTAQELRFKLSLDQPSPLVVPVVVELEGVAGGMANRDFAPGQWTRFFEIGATEQEVVFRLLDNPAPAPTAALRAKVVSGAGMADPFATSPPVAYRKERSSVPTATQRIVGAPGDWFTAVSFDGDELLGTTSQPGHFVRPREGRIFASGDLPQHAAASLYPRPNLGAASAALHGDLLVLGRPGAPGQSKTEGIQIGRKSGPGTWDLQPVLNSPMPAWSSGLGSHTASNGRYLAVVQSSPSYDTVERMFFFVYDLSTTPARYVGSIGTRASLFGMSGYPLVAMDGRNRIFYRDFQGARSCLAVAQVTPGGVTLVDRIFPELPPRVTSSGTFGMSVRIAGDRVIASDSGCTVDGWLSAGAVYVFGETAAGWVTRQVLLSDEPGFVKSFGHATVTERDWLVVGEPGNFGRGRIHFYRAGAAGYERVSATKEFAPAIGNDRELTLGSRLMMAKGCVLAPVQEAFVSDQVAIYAFDLTRDEDFAGWCDAGGWNSGDPLGDEDGDGLSLWMEWAAGGDPRARDPWWGSGDEGIWFRVSGDFNRAARLAVEFSTDLASGSWTEVAVRDGVEPWTGIAGVSSGPAPDGSERVVLPRVGERGFYRLKAAER